MFLVIAEKPSVSNSIAKVLGAYQKKDGYLEGRDCIVSWCLGHLAEYVSPDAYDERFSKGRRLSGLSCAGRRCNIAFTSGSKTDTGITRDTASGTLADLAEIFAEWHMGTQI